MGIVIFAFLIGFVIGFILRHQLYNKYDGHISIIEDEGTKRYILEIDRDPEEIDQMKSITFRVGTPQLVRK